MIYLKWWKENKKLLTTILYLAKLSFKNKGEIKAFPDKEELRESTATRPAPEMLKGSSLGHKWKNTKQLLLFLHMKK